MHLSYFYHALSETLPRILAALSISILLHASLPPQEAYAGCPKDYSHCDYICGNGSAEAGEECDDGNRDNNDACTNDCKLNFCGDAILDVGSEECDDGNSDSNDACKANCELNICGDGVIETGVEACDDGNNVDFDLCSSDCRICPEVACGNGVPELDEACDDGNTEDEDACKSDCSLNICGDGTLNPVAEQCDDGNLSGGDGCSANCQIEGAGGLCGDGMLSEGEECDDGNAIDTDACRNNCSENVCGDGSVEDGVEQCDDGNSLDGDGCSSECTTEAVPCECGNGIVEPGEECDDGNEIDGDACSNACTLNPEITPQGRVCFCHNVGHNPHTICTSVQGLINGHMSHVRGEVPGVSDLLGSCPTQDCISPEGAGESRGKTPSQAGLSSSLGANASSPGNLQAPGCSFLGTDAPS